MTSQASGMMIVDRARPPNYCGVDRSPWEVVDCAYYSRSLPAEILEVYAKMRKESSSGYWWPVARNTQELQLLKAFSDAARECDVIAVQSPYLRNVMGLSPLAVERAHFIGLDVVSLGEWSLVRTLLSSRMCGELRGSIGVNDFGLIEDEREIARLLDLYRLAADRELVEVAGFDDERLGVDIVEVFSVDG